VSLVEASLHETEVVLGLEDPALREEVLHFLDRLPRVRIVGTASDGPGLQRAVRDRNPGAVVVSTQVLADAPDLDGAAVLVVAPTETTEGLRTALRAGAGGFYLWPEERDELGRDTQRAARPPATKPVAAGKVVAVHAPRGGAGCTFLATNLAAASADRDSETVLVDLDAFGGDVTTALGFQPLPELPTSADLVPVAAELTEEHLDRVLQPHARGFRVLLAPHDAGTESFDPAGVASLIRMLRNRFNSVLLHLPRALGSSAIAALEASDVMLLVVTLDVLGLRAARRTVDLLASAGLDGRCRLVLNRASRGEIVPQDAERVLGLPVAAVIRHDRGVPRAQNRGELMSGRGSPAGRRVVALAKAVLNEERPS
jgi:pilus assembly protein CpaE